MGAATSARPRVMPPLHTEFLDALQAVSTALAELGSPAMIIGGVAVIAHGVPRLTVDIDATVVATECRPVQALAGTRTARHRPTHS